MTGVNYKSNSKINKPYEECEAIKIWQHCISYILFALTHNIHDLTHARIYNSLTFVSGILLLVLLSLRKKDVLKSV